MAQHHIIKQQVAEINCADREKARDLFNDVSRLFNNRIKDVTEEVFDRLIPEKILLRIDSLHIDLGVLPHPFREEDFAARYMDALETALSARLKEIKEKGASDEGSIENETEISRKAFIEYYLLTGTLPWWVTKSGFGDAVQVFEQLLKEDAPGLKNVIQKTAQFSYVRKRLVLAFAEENVRAVIQLLEPAQAAFIFEYHEDVTRVQKRKQIVKAELGEFEKAVWIFILDFIFENSGSNFNRKMFVKSTLAAMAARFNLSYNRLLFLFSEALNRTGELMKLSHTLPAIIDELTAESLYFQPEDEFFFEEKTGIAGDEKKEKSIVTFKRISFYLLTGSFLPGEKINGNDRLAEMFVELIKIIPQQVKELLEKTGGVENVRKRLVEMNEAAVKEVIRLVEPGGADYIIGYFQSANDIQRKKSIVKTEEAGFKKSLWEFILAFLFTERGSIFNTRMFIESNIRSMARHYNMEFRTLLSFLVQGIGEELKNDAENAGLFYLLIDILKESNKQSEPPVSEILPERKTLIPGLKTVPEVKDEEEIFTWNLLLSWLSEGTIPWWARNKKIADPAVLLEELIHKSPRSATRLFEEALGAGSISRYFFQRHSALLYRAAALFPGGKKAMDLVHFLSELTAGMEPADARQEIELALAYSLAETYREKNFRLFEEDLFLTNWFYQLKNITSLNIPATIRFLLDKLKKQTDREDMSFVSVFLKDIGKQENAISLFYETQPGFSEGDAFRILRSLAEGGGEKTEGLRPEETAVLLEKSQNILEYFFRQNKLPQLPVNISAKQADQFISRLILILFRENPSALRRLFSDPQFSFFSRMRVHDIFFSTVSAEAHAVKQFLAEFIENDLLNFVNEGGLQVGVQLKNIFSRTIEVAGKDQGKKIMLRLFASASFSHRAAKTIRNEEFFEMVAAVNGTVAVSMLKEIFSVFDFTGADSFERETLRLYLREFGFLWLSGNELSLSSKAFFIRSFLKFLAQEKNWNMEKLVHQLAEAGEKVQALNRSDTFSVLQEFYSVAFRLADDKKYIRSLTGSHEQQEEELLKKIIPTRSTEEKIPPTENEMKKENEEAKKLLSGDEIYIRNAGLALLHPFLPQFFSRTGLMLNGIFLGEEKKMRAPFLLQYAVTGAEIFEEHELVLNKILCGIDVEEALPHPGLLTENEKNISAEMLHAVIQQWDKMKNTSIAGFRGSFLQREGALILTPEAWNLKVEKRGYDVLLQTLPWSFSMIKTSWMKKPLTIEWT